MMEKKGWGNRTRSTVLDDYPSHSGVYLEKVLEGPVVSTVGYLSTFELPHPV
jgi:hypothetical protein